MYVLCIYKYKFLDLDNFISILKESTVPFIVVTFLREEIGDYKYIKN